MTDERHRDIVVRCGSGAHRVRLAPSGVRFLASARCPRCRAAVDPTRLRRLGRAILAPASSHLLDRALWWATAAALGLSLVIAVVFLWQADLWWPATVLLFGPRWTLLVPVLGLALLAALRDRALLIPLGVSAGVIIGPIMGFQLGWVSWLVRPDAGRDLTVATFNVRGGEVSTGPEALMREWSVDVAAFQECQGEFRSAVREMHDWHTWTGGSLCLISRFPISETLVMPADVIQQAGGSGLVAAHRLEAPNGPIWATNVHLDTPRAGLAQIRRGSILRGIELLERDSRLREIEHGQASRFARERTGARVVLGDFNAPAESRIYRDNWGSWTNAFSTAGFGLGGTRLNGWIRARIDHIVVDDAWDVVEAWTGRDAGSDHLPMLAELRLR